jgi:hypothetical protein
MEAVMVRLASDDDPKDCGIPDCRKPAAFQLVKMRDDGSETEEFFCEEHGERYSLRGHLVISGNL